MATANSIPTGPHGHPNPTYRGHYRKGCRCAECVEAHRLFRRQWLARRLNREPDYVQTRWQKLKLTEKGAAGIRLRRKKQAESPSEKARCLAKSKAKQRERQELLARIKVERGCADCGYRKHFAALDFDHVSGEKFMNVAMMATYSLSRIMKSPNAKWFASTATVFGSEAGWFEASERGPVCAGRSPRETRRARMFAVIAEEHSSPR